MFWWSSSNKNDDELSPCQFAVLSLTDASFAADAGLSGLRSPSTAFKGQIPTAGHLLQVAIKAIGQRVIDPP